MLKMTILPLISKTKNFNKKEILKLISILFDQGFTSIISFGSTVILSRIWDVNDYANYVLLLSITMMILGFQRALITQPYVINLHDFDDHNKNEYFYGNIWQKVIFTLIVSICLFIFPFLVETNIPIGVLYAFAIFIIFQISFYFVKDMLLSQRATVSNLKYSLITNGFISLLLIFIYFNKTAQVLYFIIPITIIYGIVFIYYLFRNWKFLSLKREKIVSSFKLNWGVGKWIVGSNFFFNISSQVYPWLLLYFVSRNEVAIYGILISISSLVNPILKSMTAYLLPIFSKHSNNHANLIKYVKKWIVVFSLFSISLILIGYFGGQEIIQQFFGEKYSNLGFLVLLPFINQGISVLFQPLDIALNAVKRTDVGFGLLVFRSAVALIVGFILVKQFGLIGVFVTKIIESILYQLFQLYYFQKIIKS